MKLSETQWETDNFTVDFDSGEHLFFEANFLDVLSVRVGEKEKLVSENQVWLLSSILAFHGSDSVNAHWVGYPSWIFGALLEEGGTELFSETVPLEIYCPLCAYIRARGWATWDGLGMDGPEPNSVLWWKLGFGMLSAYASLFTVF